MENNENYRPYSYPKEWFEEVSKLNIYQRLHGAMADVQPLTKEAKDGIKFKFHGHEAVSSLIKGVATKWRFICETSVVDHSFEVTEIYGKPRMLCILTVSVKFINIDSPNDFTSVVSVGYGVDESDKGPGKAMSYALKMALLKTFLIYDGEKLDNEAFCYQHEREAKMIADAKQRWAKLVKKLDLDIKEEGARMKREYGESPTLEAIQIDCDEMEIELAKQSKKKSKTQTNEAKDDVIEAFEEMNP